MNRLWSAAQTGLFLLDPETAHEASLLGLEAGIYPRQCRPDDPRLSQALFGLTFPNPIGVAAGYDKNARVYNALFSMGFGFAEAGTITPEPQSGNPRPRVFRLIRERAIVNRLGFNNAGHAAAKARLKAQPPKGILGINIGANRESADPIADYAAGVRALGAQASYLAVNISSPNTPGLRGLQAPDRLNALLEAVMEARAKSPACGAGLGEARPRSPGRGYRAGHGLPSRAKGGRRNPLQHDAVARRCSAKLPARRRWRPFRPAAFCSLDAVSGEMLSRDGRQIAALRRWRHRLAQAALDKIRAGASLVQLYTGLIYEGPNLLSDIKAAFRAEMTRSSSSLAGLVGTDAERWATS